MNRMIEAFRAFFGVLGNAKFAEHVATWGKPTAEAPKASVPKAIPASRNAGLAVLAVLQREARLVDFLMEPIEAYSDAQVGAAVRSVHRDAGAAVERMFGLQPLDKRAEGEVIVVEAGYDPACIRLTGQVMGEPPYRGKLCHAGWRAERCEVPEWTGREESALVVAPAEVQLG